MHDLVTLAHGGGGRLGQELLDRIFRPAFANPELARAHDGAVVQGFAFTTDSFVVSPLFFPGGDIGSLAVHGTVNDLAMCGAQPLALSAAFILEEGLPLELLQRVVGSMSAAAAAVGVPLVTGDTKVVERGKADGLFITTTGLGRVTHALDPRRIRPGDRILLSGPLAEHGLAVMSVRAGLELEGDLRSDSAPLHELTAALLAAGGDGVHVLRDPTRGGLASALNELAETAECAMELDEATLPLAEEVRGACELLGLDPLYVANEGKLVAVVAAEVAGSVLDAMRSHPLGRQASDIGWVVPGEPQVRLESLVGGWRVVDMLSGEQLPRIC